MAQSTSWQDVGQWYDKSVGRSGHFYHETVVIPGVLRLLSVEESASVLDLGCGQGVLERALPPSVSYVGVDTAASLLTSARKQARSPEHEFLVADATRSLSFPPEQRFSHAACVLALQNMAQPERAIQNAARLLEPDGKFVLVINHPSFRIPRQTSWEIDEKNKQQYRRVQLYLSSLKIPITAHPGQKDSAVTWSFHWPLQDLFKWLSEAGFVVDALEEWVSPKESQGKAAKMENRARSEFPLFLALRAKKC